jgi:hypothetical protein
VVPTLGRSATALGLPADAAAGACGDAEVSADGGEPLVGAGGGAGGGAGLGVPAAGGGGDAAGGGGC